MLHDGFRSQSRPSNGGHRMELTEEVTPDEWAEVHGEHSDPELLLAASHVIYCLAQTVAMRNEQCRMVPVLLRCAPKGAVREYRLQ